VQARLAAGVCAAVACLVARPAAQAPASPPIDELVASLQQRYSAVRDLTADFEHRVSGGVLSTTDLERGTVHIKRPGRWRFDYREPEPKLFVSDGTTVYAHFPLDLQVVVTAVPADAGASNPAAFLSGRGNLVRDFTASWGDPQEATPDTWVVRLTPLDDADYETLELSVDRGTLDIRRLATTDFLGAVSTYRFSNLRTNRDLSDTLFAFEIPPNTEVLTDEVPNFP
jgi:outer membrane lipoprotein carrier protein